MNTQYIISTRNVITDSEGKQKFGADPDETRFLAVPWETAPAKGQAIPDSELPIPSHKIGKGEWIKQVLAEAEFDRDKETKLPIGDILVIIHGYNNGIDEVCQRHRQLQLDLEKIGYEGTVVSFDWPSDTWALNYWEDRWDAKATSKSLVEDCLKAFSVIQEPECQINVHILAHSTGAYVVREAFADAETVSAISPEWTFSQIVFIGGDVSKNSMTASDRIGSAVYQHCQRLTNYQNRDDAVLKLSNAKRINLAPRVGRVGLPVTADPKGVNVDVTSYFNMIDKDKAVFYGAFCHSWHIGDPVFTKDLHETIRGDHDRTSQSNRRKNSDGGLELWPEGFSPSA